MLRRHKNRCHRAPTGNRMQERLYGDHTESNPGSLEYKGNALNQPFFSDSGPLDVDHTYIVIYGNTGYSSSNE